LPVDGVSVTVEPGIALLTSIVPKLAKSTYPSVGPVLNARTLVIVISSETLLISPAASAIILVSILTVSNPSIVISVNSATPATAVTVVVPPKVPSSFSRLIVTSFVADVSIVPFLLYIVTRNVVRVAAALASTG